MSADVFFDDVEIGAVTEAGPYLVTEQEIVAYAREWDPLPIHVSREAAIAAGLQGVSAAGVHTLSIKQRLVHRLAFVHAAMVTVGYESVKFPAPLYAGRQVTLRIDWLDKRRSQSKADRGLVTMRMRLLTDRDETVLDLTDTIFMRVRPV